MSSSRFRLLVLIALALGLAACSEPPKDAEPAAATPPAATATTAAAEATWSCPAHPDVTATEPGRCSKCGQFLTQPDHGHDHDHGHDDHDHRHGHGHDDHDHGHDDHDHSGGHSHDH